MKAERRRSGVRLANTIIVAVVVVGMMMFGGEVVLVSGQTTCNVDLQDAMTQCTAYVQKLGPQMDPSQGCCDVIKGVDMVCACGLLTPEIEGFISIPKAVHVLEFCGLKVAHGMKCGNYTIP